jgi:hypothetical protein
LATTNRLKRLERRRRDSDVATADDLIETVEAIYRLEHPPGGYTARQRMSDQGALARMRAKTKQTPEFPAMARELFQVYNDAFSPQYEEKSV